MVNLSDMIMTGRAAFGREAIAPEGAPTAANDGGEKLGDAVRQ